MPAILRFVTSPSEAVPGLPVTGHGSKDFGKGQDDWKFVSGALNNC